MPEHLPLQDLRHPRARFWRTVSGNFIDTCVLEWCKLFGDPNGEHYWKKIVSDPGNFEKLLLNHLGIDKATF
jgi:hypothetical protein